MYYYFPTQFYLLGDPPACVFVVRISPLLARDAVLRSLTLSTPFLIFIVEQSYLKKRAIVSSSIGTIPFLNINMYYKSPYFIINHQNS